MDRTVDIVVLVLSIGLVGAGLLSIALGWIVNHFAPAGLTEDDQTDQTTTDQTDRRADRPSVSAQIEEMPRLQLDRTRVALIEELLTLGWTMTDFRRERILRGDNNEISAEIETARQRLGIEAPDRVLRVRDEKGERVIPL